MAPPEMEPAPSLSRRRRPPTLPRKGEGRETAFGKTSGAKRSGGEGAVQGESGEWSASPRPKRSPADVGIR